MKIFKDMKFGFVVMYHGIKFNVVEVVKYSHRFWKRYLKDVKAIKDRRNV